MCKKLCKMWASLDRDITVNQRELLLGTAVCALAGTLLGVLLSPRKNVSIGSNNGSNNTGNTAALEAKPEAPETAEDGE